MENLEHMFPHLFPSKDENLKELGFKYSANFGSEEKCRLRMDNCTGVGCEEFCYKI